MSALKAVSMWRTLTQRAQYEDQEQSEHVERGIVCSPCTAGAARRLVWLILSPLQFSMEESDGQACKQLRVTGAFGKSAAGFRTRSGYITLSIVNVARHCSRLYSCVAVSENLVQPP